MGNPEDFEKLEKVIKDESAKVIVAVNDMKKSVNHSVDSMRSQNSAEHGKFRSMAVFIVDRVHRLFSRFGFLDDTPLRNPMPPKPETKEDEDDSNPI